MADSKLTLGGKKWTYLRPRKITLDGDDCDGLCCRETRTIKVRKSLIGLPELDATIHEMAHATGDFLDEDFVDDTSREISAALWALGYRKLSKPEITAIEKLRDG